MSNQFMTVKDVQNVLGVSASKAYEIIRKLNAQLDEQGYITLRGKVSRIYFEKKLYGKEGVIDAG